MKMIWQYAKRLKPRKTKTQQRKKPPPAAGKKQPQVVGLQSPGELRRDGCHRDVEQHPGREVVPSSNPVEQPRFWIGISGGAELSSQPC